jgi:hypothetical protein
MPTLQEEYGMNRATATAVKHVFAGVVQLLLLQLCCLMMSTEMLMFPTCTGLLRCLVLCC